jgi:putative FmdB family regulatory protein
MPIFEYKCDKCGAKSEFLEKRDNKKKHVCEKCGSSDMHKLFSGFSVGKSSHGGDSCSTGTCPTGTCGL